MTTLPTFSKPQVARFAPSPSGYLHLGHAYAAIVAHDIAKLSDGRFLLRIEDLDVGRARPEFEEAIYEDLTWLGLSWDSWDKHSVRRQSENFDCYRDYVDRLTQAKLIYPCFCTRKEIAQLMQAPQEGDDPQSIAIYPGTCRHLSDRDRQKKTDAGLVPAGRLHCERVQGLLANRTDAIFQNYDLNTQSAFREVKVDPLLFGDLIIARKDIGVSYHLAVVIDDFEQGVTLVTRGEDLFSSTHIQRCLQIIFDFDAPRYLHHRLIRDETGRRLAKRADDLSLRQLRKEGFSPDDIRRKLGLPIL